MNYQRHIVDQDRVVIQSKDRVYYLTYDQELRAGKILAEVGGNGYFVTLGTYYYTSQVRFRHFATKWILSGLVANTEEPYEPYVTAYVAKQIRAEGGVYDLA